MLMTDRITFPTYYSPDDANISTSQFQWNSEKILWMFIGLANDRTKIQLIVYFYHN